MIFQISKGKNSFACMEGRYSVCVNFLRISNIIATEKLSYSLPNIAYIWLFWFRLETTWHSKIQLGKSMKNDPIMYEIMTMLSFG